MGIPGRRRGGRTSRRSVLEYPDLRSQADAVRGAATSACRRHLIEAAAESLHLATIRSHRPTYAADPMGARQENGRADVIVLEGLSGQLGRPLGGKPQIEGDLARCGSSPSPAMEHNEAQDCEGCESEKPDPDRRRFHEDRIGETEPARDLESLRQVLGHSALSVTAGYLEATSESKRRAVQ